MISLRNNAYMQYGLQYCNEVHYVNRVKLGGAMPPQLETWGGGGGGGRVAPSLPTPMQSHSHASQLATNRQAWSSLPGAMMHAS